MYLSVKQLPQTSVDPEKSLIFPNTNKIMSKNPVEKRKKLAVDALLKLNIKRT